MTNTVVELDMDLKYLAEIRIPKDAETMAKVILASYSREELEVIHNIICFALEPVSSVMN